MVKEIAFAFLTSLLVACCLIAIFATLCTDTGLKDLACMAAACLFWLSFPLLLLREVHEHRQQYLHRQ